MIASQFILPLARELVIDLFAGGGGASTGIEQAIGRHVDIAVNHDPDAVSLHQVNHPQTRHLISDVFEVDPVAVCDGQPVGLLWASPDCKHFSKAKGGKPVSKKIRGLAWVVVKWAKLAKPRMIHLENVEEFQTWGPLLENGRVCPDRKGRTFRTWKRALERLGYVVEHRELRACDYGAPTIRKRLFLTARRDGLPIIWPAPTHGPGRKPYRTAAECIDWSIPCPSIFERERPLVDATLRRIAHGLKRFVIDSAKPFIVPVTHQGDSRVHESPGWPVDRPISTVTTQDHHHLVSAQIVGVGGRAGQSRPRSVDEPMQTITAKADAALVTSHLAKLRGTSNSAATDAPLATVSAGGMHHAEVRALLIKYYGTNQDPQLDEPLHTVTTKDRFGLVTIKGEDYLIAEIGMRMLQPRELYRAQGFPDTYAIERGADGRALSKASQVRMCGNSVCPPMARAIVAANFSDIDQRIEA